MLRRGDRRRHLGHHVFAEQQHHPRAGAVFLYRLAGALGLDTTVSNPNAADGFGDASQIGSYAKTAVFWAVERGIMGGHNNLLTPKSSATRVQLAQMLYSFDTVYAD